MSDEQIIKDNENTIREDAKAAGGVVVLEVEKLGRILEAWAKKHFGEHPATTIAKDDLVAQLTTPIDAPKA